VLLQFNDLKLLAYFLEYSDRVIKEKAVEAFSSLLWYFTVHPVPLALFDEKTVKHQGHYGENLTYPPNQLSTKRLDRRSFDHHTTLEAYVTKSPLKLLGLLTIQGQEQAKTFLSKLSAL